MSEIVPDLSGTLPLPQDLVRRVVLVLVVFFLLLSLYWWFFQGEERVPGVITRPFGSCEIDRFLNKGGLLVLGCPHMDGLKFWPLPMEQPWWEEPLFEDPYFGGIIAQSNEAGARCPSLHFCPRSTSAILLANNKNRPTLLAAAGALANVVEARQR